VSVPREAESVAARLRLLRTSLGLSQEQLARRLGVSFATVNRWESGRTQLSARAATALAELEAELASSPAAAAAARAARGPDAGGSPGRAASLPVAQSSFVGRDRELAELADLVAASRLVSLVGPGGAGKTRLAIEVLRRSFADANVVFVPLESVRFPRTLTSALASRLQVHDQPGLSLRQSVRSVLAAGPHIVVLDGAEQLAEEVAELTGELLAAVPELQFVVTSRVVLGVPGEVCWTVPALDCPSVAAGAADIAASDAVRLFIARASERLPGFRAADIAPHAIAELCRRLDGLPLAIELIAGWVGTLSIREILQQRAVLLESEPALPGQQAGRRLADVLRVSYDLLDPVQQRRLAMLSVFAGSFAVDDVQAVLDLDRSAAAVTARLLVDSSWLVVTHGAAQNRFSMLETIRAFAAAQLDKSSDGPATRRRHALHFGELAMGAEAGLAGAEAADWISRLEVAVPDLHAALDWAADTGEIDLGLDFSAGLWRWWLFSGRLGVGRSWLARFLTLAGQRTGEHAGDRAGRAHCSAAVLAAENGDYAEAIGHAELAMSIFRQLELTERMAFAATVLGSAYRYLGEHAKARDSFQNAMTLRAELGDRRGVSVAINNMALLELDDGNTDRAGELFEQSLVIKRQLGEQRSIAIGLLNLAEVLIKTAKWDAAADALTEAAGMAAGNPQLIATIRSNQGAVAAHRQDWAQAGEHFQGALTASREAGHPHDVVEALIGLGRVCQHTGRPDEAAAHLREAAAVATQIGNPQRIAEAQAALDELGAGPGRGGGRPRPGGPPPAGLTGRQAEVLGLLAAGLSNKQIAAELFLSAATVERHLATIYQRLGLSGRVEATRFAIENGLADPRGQR
jgi:predicted ATPase/DNA-binding NarL/FixJ family response regulator/DNA-binding XRE family transcriptional regulator